jgi:hypothetical protein
MEIHLKKLLLVTTLLVGATGLAHAQTALPTQGLNAGAMSGSYNTIGMPTGVVDATGDAQVNTNGFASSTSQFGLTGGTSTSSSGGNINMNGTAAMSAQRTDQAYTAAGLTATGTLGQTAGLNYANQTSALSGQTMSASAAGGTPSGVDLTTGGYATSAANLGLPTTASASSSGAIDSSYANNATFGATRVDNAASQVGVQGYASLGSLSVGGNLNAEANAGHLLTLGGTPATANNESISDSNGATSTTTLASTGLTSSASSGDSLGGNVASGSGSGSSAINAMTDVQLSGSLSGSYQGLSGSINGGGRSASNQTIN